MSHSSVIFEMKKVSSNGVHFIYLSEPLFRKSFQNWEGLLAW